MSEPDPAVALELERLRRVVEVGFERQSGALALLVQRHDQTDQRLGDHEARLDALEGGDLEPRLRALENSGQEADHETRLRTIERARWPLPTMGVLAGVAGAVTGALALIGR